MSLPADAATAQLRRNVYWILIVASAGMMIGRILAVDAVDKRGEEKVLSDSMRKDLAEKREALKKEGLSPERIAEQMKAREESWEKRVEVRRPFLSANDRSRWCAVRALVEPEMRVEGFPYAIDNVITPLWDTIDKVKHDGHLYSSKPPLLATLMAGPYWVIHRLTGATLATHPYAIGRFMLILVNVLPLVVCLWLLSRLVERLGTTDWGRMFAMAAAAFGTFLTTFAVVINNHLIAAVSATVAVYAAVRIWFDAERRWHYFAIAGFFAAFAAADELPALSLFAALAAALLWKAPRRTLAAFVPAAAVVVAAFFATNWIAHGSLRPPYAYRHVDPADNWYEFSYTRPGEKREILSYWHPRNLENMSAIDRGEPSRGVYAIHVLVGHHGVFSLTPVWVLSLIGLAQWLVRPGDRRLRELALLIGAVSLACLVFYIGVVGQQDRNYGGMTSGFRWVFWLAPLWLVAMLPAVDVLAKHCWTRCLALLLLAVSALSASYPTWNPWTQPWLYDLLNWLGWISA
jgi:hypothetical protein